ncbi:hypothetical protein P7K49_032748 [Saguinus oedipus]|uniref:Strawberry notch AAA domain-containing protein n=1 Tax=Saguinus oedipus TaxID=9490 RepID=A0ABQ9TQC8_SAGOE|nr:hypothetical protein P7K49_032748 [Saguinus oedipus]
MAGQAHKEEDEAEEEEAEELGHTETYADYVPSKSKIGKQHPDRVVETSTLSSVPPPDITYTLALPSDSGALSALQLEAITYACQQHEVLLPSRQRAGFLIGDGAGVGKGRTVAGIILENHLRGRKKALWFSVSNDLKYDAERDLRDIEAPGIAVHALSKIKYGDTTTSEGVLFATYSALIGESQAGGQHRTRLRQILDWCGEAFEGVVSCWGHSFSPSCRSWSSSHVLPANSSHKVTPWVSPRTEDRRVGTFQGRVLGVLLWCLWRRRLRPVLGAGPRSLPTAGLGASPTGALGDGAQAARPAGQGGARPPQERLSSVLAQEAAQAYGSRPQALLHHFVPRPRVPFPVLGCVWSSAPLCYRRPVVTGLLLWLSLWGSRFPERGDGPTAGRNADKEGMLACSVRCLHRTWPWLCCSVNAEAERLAWPETEWEAAAVLSTQLAALCDSLRKSCRSHVRATCPTPVVASCHSDGASLVEFLAAWALAPHQEGGVSGGQDLGSWGRPILRKVLNPRVPQIVFDECHKAKNAGSTKMGKAVLDLQNKLPLARVVYASATGGAAQGPRCHALAAATWLSPGRVSCARAPPRVLGHLYACPKATLALPRPMVPTVKGPSSALPTQ